MIVIFHWNQTNGMVHPYLGSMRLNYTVSSQGWSGHRSTLIGRDTSWFSGPPLDRTGSNIWTMVTRLSRLRGYTDTYTHIHTHTHTYIDGYLCVDMCVCVVRAPYVSVDMFAWI